LDGDAEEAGEGSWKPSCLTTVYDIRADRGEEEEEEEKLYNISRQFTLLSPFTI